MIQNLYKTHDGLVFNNSDAAFDYEVKHLGRDLIRMYDEEGYEVKSVKSATQFLVNGSEAFRLVDWKRELEGWNGIFGDDGYNRGLIIFNSYEGSVDFFNDDEIFDQGIEFEGDIQTAIYDEGWLI